MIISYDINDDGLMTIYNEDMNMSIREISECGGKTDEELEKIVEDVLDEMGVFN